VPFNNSSRSRPLNLDEGIQLSLARRDVMDTGRMTHRLLGKKTLEAEILKEAQHATDSKKQLRLPPSLPKGGSR
jgi:hypothetical protein